MLIVHRSSKDTRKTMIQFVCVIPLFCFYSSKIHFCWLRKYWAKVDNESNNFFTILSFSHGLLWLIQYLVILFPSSGSMLASYWRVISLTFSLSSRSSLAYQWARILDMCLGYLNFSVSVSPYVKWGLCAAPQTAAHLAPPSLGFSRQEYWSGVPLPSPRFFWN